MRALKKFRAADPRVLGVFLFGAQADETAAHATRRKNSARKKTNGK